MPLLVDTGVVYALADRNDAWHARVRKYLGEHPDTLLAPVTILAEVTYLLRERIGPNAEIAFIRSIAKGEMAVEPLQRQDLSRAHALMETYGDLGFVDTTVVAIAERLKVPAIATTDRRHFSAVRPAHVDRFLLVP
ncbi:MAG TPA: PIN domain-containing protein [Vicinamibacterales bacterium]|nr:PIN domain-containing protein [Vicinamibacterales bacterium]